MAPIPSPKQRAVVSWAKGEGACRAKSERALEERADGFGCSSKQTILNLVMGLGFLAHGYATGEFEVTDERLGVYLPTEHIDNPKVCLVPPLHVQKLTFADQGYAADQPGGDARKFDPRLRPPVDPRELEIDPKTGMKVRHCRAF